MIRSLFLLALFSSNVMAYVPTVESLFRHGSNPEVTANGVSFTMAVKRIAPGEEAEATPKADEHFRIFLTKGTGDTLKIAQARYRDNTFSE